MGSALSRADLAWWSLTGLTASSFSLSPGAVRQTGDCDMQWLGKPVDFVCKRDGEPYVYWTKTATPGEYRFSCPAWGLQWLGTESEAHIWEWDQGPGGRDRVYRVPRCPKRRVK